MQKGTDLDGALLDTKDAIKIVENILEEPLPDYDTDSSDSEEENQTRQDLLRIQTTGTRHVLLF